MIDANAAKIAMIGFASAESHNPPEWMIEEVSRNPSEAREILAKIAEQRMLDRVRTQMAEEYARRR